VSVSAETTISKLADCATLDADKVPFPLTVRPVETADWFIPFGMTGRKLVSDFLTDLKLSVPDKQRQLAVVDASGAIVWLVGRRTDHRFRITSKTRSVLRLSIQRD